MTESSTTSISPQDRRSKTWILCAVATDSGKWGHRKDFFFVPQGRLARRSLALFDPTPVTEIECWTHDIIRE